MSRWHVYIVRCKDGSLYTGVTTDIERRLTEHNELRTGSKYTKTRRPVSLAYMEVCETRSEACKREAQIKRLTHAEKEALAAAPA